jgi:hypothetical protein
LGGGRTGWGGKEVRRKGGGPWREEVRFEISEGGRKEGGPVGARTLGEGMRGRRNTEERRRGKLGGVRGERRRMWDGRGKFSWYFFSFFVINRIFFVDLIERMGNDKSTDGWDGTDLHG